jgi:hypothetical protein
MLCVLVYLTSVSVSAIESSNQTILLTPEKPLNGRTLITLGIPFAPGQLKNTNLFRIYNEKGDEVSIFIKPTLNWHWKERPNNTIRAVKVQFYIDKGSHARTYSFTFNSRRGFSSDLNERPNNLSTRISDDPIKAGMRSPIVISTLNTQWLEQSQIIPPFKGMNNDYQKNFWDTQFSWGRELDFTKKNIANWLYDRVSSIYKGCMRTSNVGCYREAFLSYRFWNKHIQRKGGFRSCRGGLAISHKPKKSCDNKYVYLEAIKIHVALTGDDGLHNDDLIRDMAELVYNNRWQGASYDLYDEEDEFFTERHTGLSLLTLINGYELVNDKTILKYINKHVESLYQHQIHNPDGLIPDGSFRHSWSRHEGRRYLGSGNLDDRRFSPWMMENIVDGLWQTYHILGDKRIPEMLRYAGEALEQWGFANSSGYINKFGKNLHELPNGSSWKNNCNGGDILLYSASSTANSSYLIAEQNSGGWYSDSHTQEAIFSLAVAYYFENNIVKSKALQKRITNLYNNFIKNCAGSLSKTKRAFNWSNRSNYWGTYLWVLSQKGEELPTEGFSIEAKNTISESVQEPFKEYRYHFSEHFENMYQDKWLQNEQWFVINNTIQAKGYSLFILDPVVDAGDEYRIEVNLAPGNTPKLDKAILFGNEKNVFYTARVVTGRFGAIYLYKHSSKWDMGGKVIASKPVTPLGDNNYKLVTVINNKNVKVYLNGNLYINFNNEVPFTGKNIGLFSQGKQAFVDYFLLESNNRL